MSDPDCKPPLLERLGQTRDQYQNRDTPEDWIIVGLFNEAINEIDRLRFAIEQANIYLKVEPR